MVNSGDAYVKPTADYDEEDADKSATTVASTKSFEATVTAGMSTANENVAGKLRQKW